MKDGQHRHHDACSRREGKIWRWLKINRVALSQADFDAPEGAGEAVAAGFAVAARKPAGWREVLGGWRRQTLTRQICDRFFHPLRGREIRKAGFRFGVAAPQLALGEAKPHSQDGLEAQATVLKLEDLLPESARRRSALPHVGRAGQSSILAKAA